MRLFAISGSGPVPVNNMTFQQTKQAAAVMDGIARLIPHEGVDYDVEITFKGDYDPMVSINVVALTDKGEWWRQYVMKMIKKYPPTVENPEPSIPIDTHEKNEEDRNEEVMS